MKNKLKSKIFNDKKISTKNLVIFKRWDGVNGKMIKFFEDLRGGLAKEVVMFLRRGGVETPMHTMSWRSLLIDTKIQRK